MKSSNTAVLFLRVPETMHAEIEKRANAEDRTINKQAIHLLKKALQHEKTS